MNREVETTSVRFWCFFIVGGAVTLYGLRGLISALNGITSHEFLKWFVGADIAHDLVVAPLACLAGAAISKLAPASARPQLRAGMFASAIVLAIAWAPLRGYGRANARGNSSVEPLNYATATVTVLVVVWTIAAGWIVVEARRRRRDRVRPEVPRPSPADPTA